MENEINNTSDDTSSFTFRPMVTTSFVFVILFFSLTFCDFKCASNQEILTSATGFELVVGKKIDSPDMKGMFDHRSNLTDKIPPNPWAIITISVSLFCLIVYIANIEEEGLVGIWCGILGILFLTILRFKLAENMAANTKGAIVVTFSIGYWGAMVSLALGSLFSYLHMQNREGKKTKITQEPSPKFARELSSLTPSESLDSENSPNASEDIEIIELEDVNPNEITSQEQITKDNTTSKSFVGKNVLVSLITIPIILYTAYFFLVKPSPEKDRNKLGKLSGEILKKLKEDSLSRFLKINSTYYPGKYKSKIEFENDLIAGLSAIDNSSIKAKIEFEISELEKKYGKESQEYRQILYDLSSSKYYGTENQQSIIKLNQQLLLEKQKFAENLENIKSPEPDHDKIKNDLLGRQITGWKFEYLNEFNKVSTENVIRGSSRLEYVLNLELKGSAGIHICNCLVVYRLIDEQWIFETVDLISITYDNIFYTDKWTPVTPLYGCAYEFDNKFKLEWEVNRGYFGNKDHFNTGPDASNSVPIESSKYLIRSREGKTVTVRFTYKPIK